MSDSNPSPARKRITSRDVGCPTCGAPVGEKCRGSAYSSREHRPVGYHHDRRRVARSAAQEVSGE